MGLATSPFRVLPDFIVIGTQRGGTTTLYKYLTQHHDVVPARRKEVHFFDLHFERGQLWYRSHFPTGASLGKERTSLTGEATPNYLFHPVAPGRIRETVPDARLIVLLRNPVDRAHSAWRLMVANGFETLPFEQAIRLESDRISEGLRRAASAERNRGLGFLRYSYLSRGKYAEQLERWLAAFPRNQILILRSEDLFEDPQGTYQTALMFLGLPLGSRPDFRKFNAIRGEGLNTRIRSELTEYFRPYNERLYEMLGRDFGWDG